MPTTITDLINAIPLATQGGVISPLFHNSLRDALAFLATQGGTTTSSDSNRVSVPPWFMTNESGPDWKLSNGVATQDAQGASAHGFCPIALPHGVRLQSLVVAGSRTGAVTTFNVKLVRVRIADGDPTTVFSADLATAGDPFAITQSTTGGDPSNSEALRRVDTSTYTYLVVARAMTVSNRVQLNGITVSFDRS
jgi:hypothetical protein